MLLRGARLGVLGVLIVATGMACAARATRRGIPECPAGPVGNYLADEVLQCWFRGSHGRWRTLSHDFHYGSLVFEAEATSLDDAREIAERLVAVHRERFIEIALYVRIPPLTTGRPRQIRRVRWSSASGYDSLDFES